MKKDLASSTAYSVAQGVVYSARRFGEKIVPLEMQESYEHILSGSEEGQKLLRQLDSKAYLYLLSVIERLLIPGISLHYVLRKRFIEEVTRKALSQGVTQVVNMGAGFDTLAQRLCHEYPNVNFIEIDHPTTSRLKSTALSGRCRSNLYLLEIDFCEQKLKESLDNFKWFRRSRSTLFICEGVLMYLEENEISSLLQSIRELTGLDSRIVFSCVEPADSPLNNTGLLLKLYLRLKGEALKWTTTGDGLKQFMEKQGYSIGQTVEPVKFYRQQINELQDVSVHRGEYLAVADVCCD